jgi:hypothetical protein
MEANGQPNVQAVLTKHKKYCWNLKRGTLGVSQIGYKHGGEFKCPTFQGSETWTLGKNEERVVNAFETRCWRRMLKIKWTDRITNGEVYQRAKDERLLLKM